MTKEQINLEERRAELRRQRAEAEYNAWCKEVDEALLDDDKSKLAALLKRVVGECKPGARGCLDCKHGARSFVFANGKTACQLAAEVTEKKRHIANIREQLTSHEDVKVRIEADIDELKRITLADLEARLKEKKAEIASCNKQLDATVAALEKVLATYK